MPNTLVGTWKLVTCQYELKATGERVDFYGPNPLGYLVFGGDNRMMGILMSADRKAPKTDADEAASFKSMMAYTGVYRIEGDTFITDVDLAWHPAWANTEQVRFFKVEGDTLSIHTGPQNHPRFPGQAGRAVLTWHRG